MGDILTLLSGAAGGGLIGLAGSVAQLLFKGKERKMEISREIELRKLDIEAMTTESNLRLRETETEIEGKARLANIALDESTLAGDVALRQSSYLNDKATYGGGIVDAIRGLMRPVLTAYLVIVVTAIAAKLFIELDTIPQADAWDSLSAVIVELVTLSSMTVSWWFGTRPPKR